MNFHFEQRVEKSLKLIVNFPLINIGIWLYLFCCLVRFHINFCIYLLDLNFSFFHLLIGKNNCISRIKLQVINWLKRMHHPIIAIRILNNSFIGWPQTKHINSIFIQSYKIIIFWYITSLNLTFPKLKRLMPVHYWLISLMVNI